MLKYILLGFLNYQPLTGYQIKTLMEHSTLHFWHAYHSQIYTTLRTLESDGLVSSEVEDGDEKLNRRRYDITSAGRADLAGWLRHPMLTSTQVKEELLVRMFFSAQRNNEDVIDELRIQRRLHQQQLDEYLVLNVSHAMSGLWTSMEDLNQAQREAMFWSSTLQFGIAFERMYLAWLDDLIEQISAS